MKFTNRNHAFASVFVDELARAGVRHASISPGSRSTPLTLALAAHPGITTWVHPDERCGAFFALGLARALGEPVAVVCTSGTAVANYLPAVVEASATRIPLLFLTADHPFETRGCGEPQVIDQTHIFGRYPKWFVDLGAPEVTVDLLRTVRTLAGRATAIARAAPAGPVHLNFPFRKPLTAVEVPADFPPGVDADALAWSGRDDGPYVEVIAGQSTAAAAALDALAATIRASRRGVIVCGPQDDAEAGCAAVELGRAAGFPVIADGLSQARFVPGDHPIVDRHDLFLRYESTLDRLAPDLVIRTGTIPTSGPLVSYLRRHGAARQIVIDDTLGWRDPLHVCSQVVWASPGPLCAALAAALPSPVASPEWTAQWKDFGRRTSEAVAEVFAERDEMFEGRLFAEVADLVPDGALIYLGNSMPVRDFEAFFPSGKKALRVYGNRGAAGIDGVVSSALGAAAAGNASRTFLFIGDLSFYHDLNGLLAAKLHQLRATLVVLNNDGGGIFSFLPESKSALFERYFGTPHGIDFAAAAKAYGLDHVRASDWSSFRGAIEGSLSSPGTVIVEVPTLGRADNVAAHARVWDAVARATGGDGTRYSSP